MSDYYTRKAALDKKRATTQVPLAARLYEELKRRNPELDIRIKLNSVTSVVTVFNKNRKAALRYVVRSRVVHKEVWSDEISEWVKVRSISFADIDRMIAASSQ